jgi:hypothetical protein
MIIGVALCALILIPIAWSLRLVQRERLHAELERLRAYEALSAVEAANRALTERALLEQDQSQAELDEPTEESEIPSNGDAESLEELSRDNERLRTTLEQLQQENEELSR